MYEINSLHFYYGKQGFKIRSPIRNMKNEKQQSDSKKILVKKIINKN
jgi:hypothetical protein